MTQPSGRLVVIDASAVVALLSDAGSIGEWARTIIGNNHPVAPSVMPYEAANTLRTMALHSGTSFTDLEPLHSDLLKLAVAFVPYHPALAVRAWELAPNLSIYDASYVALAELLNAPLVTLDARLSGAPGIQCEVLVFA